MYYMDIKDGNNDSSYAISKSLSAALKASKLHKKFLEGRAYEKSISTGFPKLMRVWDSEESNSRHMVVLCNKGGDYPYLCIEESDFNSAWHDLSVFPTYCYKYADEVEVEEMTIEQVREELGRHIKIVKDA